MAAMANVAWHVLLGLLFVMVAVHGLENSSGWVGMNHNADLILNSGTNRSVLANGVDILARLAFVEGLAEVQALTVTSLKTTVTGQATNIATLNSIVAEQTATISAQAAAIASLITTVNAQTATLLAQTAAIASLNTTVSPYDI